MPLPTCSLPAAGHFRCECLGTLWTRKPLSHEGSWPDPFSKALYRLAFHVKWYPGLCQCSLADVVGSASLACLPNMHDFRYASQQQMPALRICTAQPARSATLCHLADSTSGSLQHNISVFAGNIRTLRRYLFPTLCHGKFVPLNESDRGVCGLSESKLWETQLILVGSNVLS